MKAQTSSKLFYFAALLFIITSNIYSQDMKKPDPVNNETVNMLLGKWEAEPYEMFSTKRGETTNYYLDINNSLCS